MTTEEKARAYDEALKVLHKYDGANIMFSQSLKEEMFPELKESEDEKIRKEMICYFEKYPSIVIGPFNTKECIAWLEKQPTPQVRTGLEWVNTIDDACDKRYSEEYAHGEYCHEQSFKWGFQEGVDWLEKQGEHAKFINGIQVGDKVTRNEDGVLVNLSQLQRVAKPAENTDKQGEQKHVIAPKFNIGDTIRNKITNEVFTITNRCVSLEYYSDISHSHEVTFSEQDDWELVKQKPAFEMKTPEESLGIDSDTYNKIVDECVYGEQNPADKVEPRFKVGDWITNGIDVYKIKNIDLNEFNYIFENGISDISLVDNICHLWTIQDAKDGDVLVDEDDRPFIFKGFLYSHNPQFPVTFIKWSYWSFRY